jgi:hypothetical protein
LLDLTGNGAWFHLMLINAPFSAWTGLLVTRPFLGPTVIATAATLLWLAGFTSATWAILRGREFVPAVLGERRQRRYLAPLRVVATGAVALLLADLATGLGPAGVTRSRLSTAIGTTFRNLTVYQQQLIGHPIPPGSRYTIVPLCNKRGARPVGLGDWDCTMEVYVLLPGGSQPLTDTPVDYDVSVAANGCFKADAPAYVVGGQTLSDGHRRVFNPLTVLYGCFNVL